MNKTISWISKCDRCNYNVLKDNQGKNGYFTYDCYVCGYKRSSQIVHNYDSELIASLVNIGYNKSKESNLQDYSIYSHVHKSLGCCIKTFINGDTEINTNARNFNKKKILKLIRQFKSKENLVTSKCYLALWCNDTNLLEVLFGISPFDYVYEKNSYHYSIIECIKNEWVQTDSSDFEAVLTDGDCQCFEDDDCIPF